MAQPHTEFLADHSLLLAIPAFAPAIAVVAVVIYIAVRDRRTPDDSPSADRKDNSQ